MKDTKPYISCPDCGGTRLKEVGPSHWIQCITCEGRSPNSKPSKERSSPRNHEETHNNFMDTTQLPQQRLKKVTYVKPLLHPAACWFLLLISPLLGYIGSYFFQPGLVMAFLGLGNYMVKIGDVLFPHDSPHGSDAGMQRWANELNATMSTTAWSGVVIGFVIMLIITVILGRPRQRERIDLVEFP